MYIHVATNALFREAKNTYQVPSDTLIIEKGQKIMIPIYSLHHDPKYFADPFKFDPERFAKGEKAKILKGTYLPFGVGPRFCIGFFFLLTGYHVQHFVL